MTSSKLGQLTSATLAIVTMSFAAATAQAPITWSVKDINDKNDISTRGKLCIAANLGPEVCEKVVNGVHFQADRSHWTRKILSRGQPPTREVLATARSIHRWKEEMIRGSDRNS